MKVRQIGPYEIIEKLGEGGMGVVWKARDTRLNRFIALKMLPAKLAADPTFRARMLQEAQAASSLNHPNIITIHDIGEHQGNSWLALEFVEGKTLDQMIGGKGLRSSEALQIACQIAAALEAAHAAGILHRDLKPSNIMVSGKGQVKLLDFGLAKLREPSTNEVLATATLAAQTAEGAIVGTAAYMSPEQAEAKTLDARSDLFSFGAVLYEMLSGIRAFKGESTISTLAAILQKEPPSLDNVPAAAERIVRKCLRKDPGRRFQDAADLRVAIEDAMEEVRSGVLPGVVPVKPRSSGMLWGAGLGLVGMLAGAGGFWTLGYQSSEPVTVMTLLQLTRDAGLNRSPALSRDGKLLAWASDRSGEGHLDIWLKQVGGSASPMRITDNPGMDCEPTFSPDGSKLAFASDRDGGGIYVIPSLGGLARKIAVGGRNPRWSPNGRWIAYGVRQGIGFGYGGIRVVPSEGGEENPPIQSVFSYLPVWTPDNRLIVYRVVNRRMEWALADPAHPREELASYDLPAAALASAPFYPKAEVFWGSRLIASRLADSAAMINVPSGTSSFYAGAVDTRTSRLLGRLRPLVLSPTDVEEADASDAGLVFTATSRARNVWSLPWDARTLRSTGEPRRTGNDKSLEVLPAVTLTGDRLAYRSDRSGVDEAWVRDLATGKENQISLAGEKNAGVLFVVVARDGTVYFQQQGPNPEARGVFRPKPESGMLVRVDDGGGRIFDVSPDNRYLLRTTPNRVQGSQVSVSVTDLQTGKKHGFLASPDYGILGVQFSPDGRWIVFYGPVSANERRISIAAFRGVQPIPPAEWITVVDEKGLDREPRWSPDGNAILFLSKRDGRQCIWAKRLDPVTKKPAGEATAVHHFHDAALNIEADDTGPIGLAVSTKAIYLSMIQQQSNIWMLREAAPVPRP